MNHPDVFYVLESGPSKGQSRPAVIVKRTSETCAQIVVFVDGDFDGFQANTIWRSSVPFNDFGAPGTMHVVGPGCVTYRDNPENDGSIEVDRTDPFNPIFKYEDKPLPVSEITPASGNLIVPAYSPSEILKLGMAITTAAEELSRVTPDEREEQLNLFVAQVELAHGPLGVSLFNDVVKQWLEENWRLNDEREARMLYGLNQTQLTDKSSEGADPSPASESPLVPDTNSVEPETVVTPPLDQKPKQLISDDKLKEIFGEDSGETETAQSDPEKSTDEVK